MKISRYCLSLKAAELYQNKLYKSYDSVKLISFPFFGDAGMYEWEVK